MQLQQEQFISLASHDLKTSITILNANMKLIEHWFTIPDAVVCNMVLVIKGFCYLTNSTLTSLKWYKSWFRQ